MQFLKANLESIGIKDVVMNFLVNDIKGSVSLFDFSMSLTYIFNLNTESNSRRYISHLSMIAHVQSLTSSLKILL